ncbi:hypothetical protein L5M43_15130 [Shewanella sp. SW36]|uniref:hypothetical protein n=1 Tax=unclassified Shewanella TaxID=196818 RepID=UPI0021D9BEE1|nr:MULTISPECIES: hypothetical protein [unclassified Shewanella]MCU7976575.1 hypothetical protein [Shewanella sp. SW36]MCU7991815.1 hypothetical protein [Shewanella sp. SW1]MCU8014227.1 hypothetical protein [Shewanella sp. SM74]MCU8053195.1 hypothetical protein [Shewanella sp. SM43]
MLAKLSTLMEVTVGGMDAAVEPSGMSLWRVTGVRVLNINPICDTLFSTITL